MSKRKPRAGKKKKQRPGPAKPARSVLAGLPIHRRADALDLAASAIVNRAGRNAPDVESMRRAVGLWAEALQLVPIDDPYWDPYRLHNLLRARWDVAQASRDRGDLTAVRELAEQLIRDPRSDPRERALYARLAGTASELIAPGAVQADVTERLDQGAGRDDAEYWLPLCQAAVRAPGIDERDLAQTWLELGRVSFRRFAETRDGTLLTAAQSAFETARAFASPHVRVARDAARSLNLTKLTAQVLDGTFTGPSPQTMAELLGALNQAGDDDERQEAAEQLGAYATAIGAVYDSSGDGALLESAVALATIAYGAAPAGQNPSAVVTSAYATAYLSRHLRTQDPADLERVRAALAKIDTSDLDARLAAQLDADSVEVQLRALYGDPQADIDAVVEFARRSLARLERSGGSDVRLQRLCADAVLLRSSSMGAPEDLAAAIAEYRRLLAIESDPARRAPIAAGLGLALLNEAKVLDTRGAYDAAIDQLVDAHASTKPASADFPGAVGNLRQGYARRFARFDDPEDLRRAIDVGERALAPRDDVNFAFRLGAQRLWYRVYEGLIDDLLRLAERAAADGPGLRRRAFELSEIARESLFFTLLRDGGSTASREQFFPRSSDDTVDALKRSALAPFSPKDAGRVANPLNWERARELARDAGPATVLVTAFSVEHSTWWFGIDPARDEPVVIETAVSRYDWFETMKRLGQELVLGDGVALEQTWHHRLRPLAALQPLLRAALRLAVVNHQATHRLPWGALTRRLQLAGEDGAPIAVLALPTLAIVDIVPGRSAPPATAIVVADPDRTLTFAADEADVVGGLLAAGVIRHGDATRAAVLPLLGAADVIHWAGHAELVDHPREPVGLRLADGTLGPRDILELRLRADLVVLSACFSGYSATIGREEFVSLAQTFIAAGAGTVVASLWLVDDQCSVEFMRAFYTRWLAGVPAEIAANEAMTNVRAHARWEHPHWWAPFVVTGRHLVHLPRRSDRE